MGCDGFLCEACFTNLILARAICSCTFIQLDYAADAVRHGHLPLWNPTCSWACHFSQQSDRVLYPSTWRWRGCRQPRNQPDDHFARVAGRVGAYIFARRSLGLSRLAAWLGAVTFALGGYLGAQVEHVNQLQALAWLPFLFMLFDLTSNVGG